MDKPVSIPINPDPPSIAVAAAGTPPASALDPVAALAALGSPVRWPIVQMLADGRELSASAVAAALKRDFDAVSKHLRILRDAGVVACRPGEDRRVALYFIPAANRPEPGVIDYAFCRLRLSPGSNRGRIIPHV